jgi:enolase
MISRVRSAATLLMQEEHLTTLLADEGGLSPGFERAEQALTLMVRSFEAAGLQPVAASELYDGGQYVLKREQKCFDGRGMLSFLADLARRFPIISIEDALEQDDWQSWRELTQELPEIQVVGDDLFVTNIERIKLGIERKVANAALIKLNQNGTLTGTLSAMAAARAANYATVVSARSGETEDIFIADLAVGTGAGQIKIGSVRSSERLAKYNQLLRIEDEAALPFAGVAAIRARRLVAAG